MTPAGSTGAFRAFAAGKGVELDASTPRDGVHAMLAFHAAVPCPSCSDDVLLYQWGRYDWGAGPHFELNITRQFIEPDADGDNAISQLSLTYRYPPSAELDGIAAGSRWSDGPGDFLQSIVASPAFAILADRVPQQVELLHSPT